MKNRTLGPKLMLFISFFVWLNSLEKSGWPLVLATIGTLGFLIMVIYLQVKMAKEKKQKSEIR
jgi:hypothetical protein